MMKSSIINAKTTTKIRTSNIQILYQCGKLTQLLTEFDNYHLDIVGIRKTRWTDSGKMYHDGKIMNNMNNMCTALVSVEQRSGEGTNWMVAC